jgi:ParB family transcriptional regulator, chromosome partitioning protein
MQTTQTRPAENYALIPVEQIATLSGQPRRIFDDEELLQLSESIKNHGILQPLVVRQAAEGFQIIAGERRFRAAQVVGLKEVPVHIVNFNDRETMEAALVENIQRADLNPIEKATGFKEYCERFNISREELATKLGIDKSTVINLIGILSLPNEVQDAIRLNYISLGHAKILKSLPRPDQQVAMCKETVLKGLSVKALELHIRAAKAEKEKKANKSDKEEKADHRTEHVLSLENELRQRYATKTEIKLKEKDKGQIVLHFDDNDQFERIVSLLHGRAA